MLTFFRPAAIGFSNLGRNLGNEGLIWYEALHAWTNKYDSDLEGLFDKDFSCSIILNILNPVLSTSEVGLSAINSEVQWNNIVQCAP